MNGGATSDMIAAMQVCEFLQDDATLSRAIHSLATLLQEDLKTRVFPASLRNLPGNVRSDPAELQQEGTSDNSFDSSTILQACFQWLKFLRA